MHIIRTIPNKPLGGGAGHSYVLNYVTCSDTLGMDYGDDTSSDDISSTETPSSEKLPVWCILHFASSAIEDLACCLPRTKFRKYFTRCTVNVPVKTNRAKTLRSTAIWYQPLKTIVTGKCIYISWLTIY